MFNKILRKLRFKKNNNTQTGFLNKNQSKSDHLSKNLTENIKKLTAIFGTNTDVLIREFKISCKNKTRAAIFFINGLVDKEIVNQNIMKPLMVDTCNIQSNTSISKIDFNKIKNNVLCTAEIKESGIIEEILIGIFSGSTVILIDGCDSGLLVCTTGYETRGVAEPHTEAVIRGPREGFTESLITNTAMLRRKIKSPNLVFEKMVIGTVTKTTVCIAYLKQIANDKIVKELMKRLCKINIDGILESGYIEEFIEDEPFSIFATIGNSEKPDIVAAKLLEGRIAVFTDGTPVVLTLPYLFVETIQNSEDYYSRPWFATMMRLLRITSMIFTISLPGLYVAAESYHYEMIPTVLLITVAAAKQGTPFPVGIESLIMLVTFEILREAGVRMPRPIGQAVSIVGALVLGEAAVNAGIVSAPTVIITAITGISGFVVPSQNDSLTITRFLLLILAGVSGLFGLILGVIFLLIHMTSLRSFGIPYLSPIAPHVSGDLKDVAIRAPLWMMRKRPQLLGKKNSVRMGDNGRSQKPKK